MDACFPFSGKIWGQDHWKRIYYDIHTDSEVIHTGGIIDTTTNLIYELDEFDQDPWILRLKAAVVIEWSVPYLIVRIALPIIRFVAISLYLGVQTLRGVKHGDTLSREFRKTVAAVAKAPLYWVGYLFSALYMLYDPFNGRKLVAAYEHALDPTPVKQSIHVAVPREHFIYTGVLDDIGYKGPGCFQPIAELKEGRIYPSVQCDGAAKAAIPKNTTILGRPQDVPALLFDRLDLSWPIESKVWGFSQWKRVEYGSGYCGYANLSTLDESGTGTVEIFQEKEYCEWQRLATMITIVTPVYMAVSIAYNLLRIIPVITYIACGIIFEKMTGRQIYQDDRKFRLADLSDQVCISVCNCIRTLLYGTGFFLGILYARVDPLNGRQVAASFEKGWNRGEPLRKGYWSKFGPMVEAQKWFEGGGRPSQLGRTIFYMAGCLQTMSLGEYQDGQLKNARYLLASNST